ncbi:hypothetical protein D1007_22865 [Hordeum vulgare]|nr:hypothetical protein D1007_22865 [Hordeum vulgare]
MPVEMRPRIDSHSSEARVEILQVVQESCRFPSDDGGMDYDLIFWAIHEAESSDPLQAARWRRFKSTSPSRLNIRPLSFAELANIPLEHLPPGVSPPRLP